MPRRLSNRGSDPKQHGFIHLDYDAIRSVFNDNPNALDEIIKIQQRVTSELRQRAARESNTPIKQFNVEGTLNGRTSYVNFDSQMKADELQDLMETSLVSRIEAMVSPAVDDAGVRVLSPAQLAKAAQIKNAFYFGVEDVAMRSRTFRGDTTIPSEVRQQMTAQGITEEIGRGGRRKISAPGRMMRSMITDPETMRSTSIFSYMQKLDDARISDLDTMMSSYGVGYTHRDYDAASKGSRRMFESGARRIANQQQAADPVFADALMRAAMNARSMKELTGEAIITAEEAAGNDDWWHYAQFPSGMEAALPKHRRVQMREGLKQEEFNRVAARYNAGERDDYITMMQSRPQFLSALERLDANEPKLARQFAREGRTVSPLTFSTRNDMEDLQEKRDDRITWNERAADDRERRRDAYLRSSPGIRGQRYRDAVQRREDAENMRGSGRTGRFLKRLGFSSRSAGQVGRIFGKVGAAMGVVTAILLIGKLIVSAIDKAADLVVKQGAEAYSRFATSTNTGVSAPRTQLYTAFSEISKKANLPVDFNAWNMAAAGKLGNLVQDKGAGLRDALRSVAPMLAGAGSGTIDSIVEYATRGEHDVSTVTMAMLAHALVGARHRGQGLLGAANPNEYAAALEGLAPGGGEVYRNFNALIAADRKMQQYITNNHAALVAGTLDPRDFIDGMIRNSYNQTVIDMALHDSGVDAATRDLLRAIRAIQDSTESIFAWLRRQLAIAFGPNLINAVEKIQDVLLAFALHFASFIPGFDSRAMIAETNIITRGRLSDQIEYNKAFMEATLDRTAAGYRALMPQGFYEDLMAHSPFRSQTDPTGERGFRLSMAREMQRHFHEGTFPVWLANTLEARDEFARLMIAQMTANELFFVENPAMEAERIRQVTGNQRLSRRGVDMTPEIIAQRLLQQRTSDITQQIEAHRIALTTQNLGNVTRQVRGRNFGTYAAAEFQDVINFITTIGDPIARAAIAPNAAQIRRDNLNTAINLGRADRGVTQQNEQANANNRWLDTSADWLAQELREMEAAGIPVTRNTLAQRIIREGDFGDHYVTQLGHFNQEALGQLFRDMRAISESLSNDFGSLDINTHLQLIIENRSDVQVTPGKIYTTRGGLQEREISEGGR